MVRLGWESLNSRTTRPSASAPSSSVASVVASLMSLRHLGDDDDEEADMLLLHMRMVVNIVAQL